MLQNSRTRSRLVTQLDTLEIPVLFDMKAQTPCANQTAKMSPDYLIHFQCNDGLLIKPSEALLLLPAMRQHQKDHKMTNRQEQH